MHKNNLFSIFLILVFLQASCLLAGDIIEQRITDIRFWQSPEEAQVVIDVSKQPNVSDVLRLDNGTLFFDIRNCKFKPGQASYPLKNQFLEVLSVQQNNEDQSSRVYFKVPRGVDAKTFVLPRNERKGDRIVIFLREPQAKILQRQSAVLAEVKKLKAENIKIIVLDPGHGGEDPGTQANGIVEKSYVLAMGKLVKAYFDRDPRYKAILTRETDYIIPLERRREMAERLGADAFVSLHVNFNYKRDIRGIEVYYESPKGALNETDRLVAESENLTDLGTFQTTPTYSYGANSKSQIAQLQANMMDQSRQLAEKVELKLAQAVPALPSRGVKRAGFKVLHSLNMPSILVEYAYTSNFYDANILKDYTARTKLAQAVYLGVSNYLQTKVDGGVDTEYLEYYKEMSKKKAKAAAAAAAKKKKKTATKSKVASTSKSSKSKAATTKTTTKKSTPVKSTKKHTVKAGETLTRISVKYGVSVASIQKANGMKNSADIKVGQVLTIPAK